jgi:hypothetical protein
MYVSVQAVGLLFGLSGMKSNAMFGWEEKVKGKNIEGMKVDRKWDDFLIVCFEW